MKRTQPPLPPGEVPYVLFRRAAVPAALAACGCVVVATVVSGVSGLVGALLGAVIVVLFYVIDLLTLRLAERLAGSTLMPLMMTEYVVKISVLALLLLALWNTTAFDVRAMAVTVAVATVVWTVALGVIAARIATFNVDVNPQPPQGGS
ncbi:MAG TPA: hypothetical protein VMT27_01460 [Actinomycetes bacterium]|nr:hypothetical protein [Actinomycetes bacterium]